MKMRRNVRACIAAVGVAGGGWLVGGLGTVAADPGPFSPPIVLVELGDNSSYAQGCVGECLCPITFTPEVSGFFGLEAAGVDANGNTVSNVGPLEVTVGSGDDTLLIEGFGTYKVNDAAGRQRMDLVVTINGGDQFRMTSGWTALGDGDGIEIALDNVPVCFGVFLTLSTVTP